MKIVKPSFQSVEIDLVDRRLEVQAAEKGIPTLIVANPASDVAETVPASSETAAPKPRRAGEGARPTPRARMKTLNLEVPDYAWSEIKMRAAREMTSVRHVIMTALKSDGIEIKEIDMIEDGRRLRGSEGV